MELALVSKTSFLAGSNPVSRAKLSDSPMRYLFAVPLRYRLRLAWHNLVMRIFHAHFDDELTQAIHPEFGWIWRDEEVGGRMIKGAEDRGRSEALNKKI